MTWKSFLDKLLCLWACMPGLSLFCNMFSLQFDEINKTQKFRQEKAGVCQYRHKRTSDFDFILACFLFLQWWCLTHFITRHTPQSATEIYSIRSIICTVPLLLWDVLLIDEWISEWSECFIYLQYLPFATLCVFHHTSSGSRDLKCRIVHCFGPDWNVSTTIRWIANVVQTFIVPRGYILFTLFVPLLHLYCTTSRLTFLAEISWQQSMTISWIAIKFGIDLYVSFRMNCTNFGDPSSAIIRSKCHLFLTGTFVYDQITTNWYSHQP